MPKYQVNIGGTVIVEAADQIEAEDTAMDLLNGDITAWVDTNAEIDVIITDTKELDD